MTNRDDAPGGSGEDLCATCGHPRHPHNFRHMFKPAAPDQGAVRAEREACDLEIQDMIVEEQEVGDPPCCTRTLRAALARIRTRTDGGQDDA